MSMGVVAPNGSARRNGRARAQPEKVERQQAVNQ
jgi:hypothetical protein